MTPEVSALLTTYNRAHLLPRMLEGLARQTIDPARFELVAIDDGSIDQTPQILAAWMDRLPLRVVRQHHAGIAAARSLAVFVARGPILVFLDDDDVADPDLLAAHLAAHHNHPDRAMAVLGHTSLAPDIQALPLMRHVTEVGCQLFSYGTMQPGQVMDYTAFWGGRSSCKRALLVRHGVFNPEFQFGFEDIELGFRLSEHGLQVVYEPGARSTMIRALTFDQFCARSYWQGRSQFRFSRLHSDSNVRAYCEIDAAEEAWTRERYDYAAHLRWTRKLDCLATGRQVAGLPPHSLLQKTLDDAYRKAFFLSRAKGVSDAADLGAVVRPAAAQKNADSRVEVPTEDTQS